MSNNVSRSVTFLNIKYSPKKQFLSIEQNKFMTFENKYRDKIASFLLSKHGIQLFWYIVLFVVYRCAT